VQYHPESTPGPHDSRYLFDDFMEMIRENKG
jgi:carbamoyl-phosphate synthase small subunit